ncbi:ubiquitin conjugating enzyme E2, putative [Babesia bigemina]|uniref:Ubiquitin conjugating enzyme E2, putative n=1 Tax=Babesia bigemina TaxID=5866 RepID=A0A061DEK9_BABBI|nr:ubiquitin conjugating enzyme E2, putative [Babesia bigemina]CDR97460.1 ubiquitin conjugating enzyme E2, putative [Babesia bigemina]|eukprot:XP_012769646.1 ubiquitin conjugating enzyme E2, putative [Babesia bigemina]
MVNIAREILRRQYIELTRDDNCTFSVGLEDDDLFQWRVCFEGPYGTPFEGGIFTVVITFPDTFPNNPPQMKFEQKMWHPNIYPDGRVCISILHPPGMDIFNDQEAPEERWRPVLSVESIILSVISMLSEPNAESPANVDAAVEFKNDPQGYKRRVQIFARNTVM